MGKHDSDEEDGFFLNGANTVKDISLWFKDNIKVIGIVALIPIIGFGAYCGVKYFANKKNDDSKVIVPVVASNNEEKKEYVGGYEILGNVKINNLGIDVKILNPIHEGTKYVDDALKYGVVEYYGNGINEIGNCTIIGHNNSDNFFNLKNIEKDDEIIIVDSEGVEVKYTVIEKNNVEATDFSGLLPMEENSREITLITCDEGATTRLVVKAISK